MKNKILTTAIVLLTTLSMPGRTADIVALCIGNDDYVRSEDVLDTPVSDATLMHDTLRAIPGVTPDDVVLLPNGTREAMRAALRQFREKARGAKLSIVFYSGHGIEDQPAGYDHAETFLLPIDAVIEGADQLPDRAVGLGDVLDVFKGLPPAGRVVILDCCRTGAPSATKAMAGAGKNVAEDLDARVARALGQAELAEGTLVSFSAGPGRKAAAFLRDTDAYSPFTHFLAKGIREQGGDLFGIVSLATATTREATGGKQVPRVKFEGDPSLISAVKFPAADVGHSEAGLASVAAMSEAEIERRAKEMAEQLVAEAMSKQPAPASSTPDPRPSTPAPMVKTDPVTVPDFPANRGMEGSRAGEVRTFGGIEMVWCPPGEFLMGSPEDEEGHSSWETQHRESVAFGFWLAKTECTQAQWETVMGTTAESLVKERSTDIKVNATGPDVAMYFTSWNDAQEWLAEMNKRYPLPADWKWDLPTEVQWEYSCRAGTKTAIYSGEFNAPMLDRIAWYGGNSSVNHTGNGDDTRHWNEKQLSEGNARVHVVGLKQANNWGLHDMIGNVWEWCSGKYVDYTAWQEDPFAITKARIITAFDGNESDRIVRGGGVFDRAVACRSAVRYWLPPGMRNGATGFRPALVQEGR